MPQPNTTIVFPLPSTASLWAIESIPFAPPLNIVIL